MDLLKMNLGKFLFNLAFGWFLFALLQAVAVSIFTGGWGELWGRFLAIALFRNRTGALINLVVILVMSAVGIAIWINMIRR